MVTLDFENFTTYDLKHLELEYRPTQIMIEANGMMDLNIFVKETIPENWKVVQVLTTFDTTTFSMYLIICVLLYIVRLSLVILLFLIATIQILKNPC